MSFIMNANKQASRSSVRKTEFLTSHTYSGSIDNWHVLFDIRIQKAIK